MYKNLLRNIGIIFCLFLSSCATFSDSGIYFQQAKEEVKRKNYASAFMKLRASLTENKHSRYAPNAAFSIAEYYFDSGDYSDAVLAFYNYIKNYPKDSGVIFAEFIIYKISTQIKSERNITLEEKDLIESIRKKIFSKPLFFIFSKEEKSFSYRSVFSNTYTAFDYVDKVKVMRNGELFLEVSP